MNRRDFLSKLLLPTAGGVALASVIPLGRVWSFPSKLSIQNLWKPQTSGLDLSTNEDMTALILYTTNDAEFIESVHFTREQIAAIFRVPVKFLPLRTLGVSPLQPLADYLHANPRLREQILAEYSH